eukprot:SM000039S14494  [mRNA]  locus=s39:452616:460352:- [translate_table: standard]
MRGLAAMLRASCSRTLRLPTASTELRGLTPARRAAIASTALRPPLVSPSTFIASEPALRWQAAARKGSLHGGTSGCPLLAPLADQRPALVITEGQRTQPLSSIQSKPIQAATNVKRRAAQLQVQSKFNETAWQHKLLHFRHEDETELVLRSKSDRLHAEKLTSLAGQLGLDSKLYGKVFVISKDPLPRYRPDLDNKRPQREFKLSESTRRQAVKHLQDYWRRSRADDMAAPSATLTSSAVLSGRADHAVNGGAGLLNDIDTVTEPCEEDIQAALHKSTRTSLKGVEHLEGSVNPRPRVGLQTDRQIRQSERLKQRHEAWQVPSNTSLKYGYLTAISIQAMAEAQKVLQLRKSLPAFGKRQMFLDAIRKNQVVVISGETGCGKTTQLPQYILESEIAAGRGALCNIVCTQPRRISAISVAERVASECGEEVGELVGYQVRLEKSRSQSTRLLFCTTGTLLRQLQSDPVLRGISHVIVDEIHERGINEDFLLIVLQKILPRRPDLRVLLMSATLDAKLFSGFFGGAPVIHIPGFTYPVKTHFLEDILEMTGHVITPSNQVDDYGSGKKWRQYKQLQYTLGQRSNAVTDLVEEALQAADFGNLRPATQRSLECWAGEGLGFNLIETVLAHICRKEGPGAILVIMTGWEDISALNLQLRAHPLLGDEQKVLLLCCHGSMATDEQRLIFKPPHPGVRKIVLATNIVETSITINDVIYVVDCGKMKEKTYDALNNTPCLLPSWISQASARQRSGRAGRVQPGVCFHLYPKVVFEALPKYQQPELLRTPLDALCLQIKSLGLGGVAQFLSCAPQPPDKLAVQKAVQLLTSIGAFGLNEELTPLGRHLCDLPVDPRIGKMLIIGAVFQCLSPILTVAAGLTFRDPFVIPTDQKEVGGQVESVEWAADNVRGMFGAQNNSDHMALVRAFDGWTAAVRSGQGGTYCWDNFLSMRTLQMMSKLRMQLVDSLSGMGFVDDAAGSVGANKNSGDSELVKGIICGGLFPNVASGERRARSTMFKTVEDGQVSLHPASINAKEPLFAQPWLVFDEKMMTSSIFIRSSTGISDAALLLFGGTLTPGDEPGYIHMLDQSLEFFMTPEAGRLVLALRGELDALVNKKARSLMITCINGLLLDPKTCIEEEMTLLLECVRMMLHCQDSDGAFISGRIEKKPAKMVLRLAQSTTSNGTKVKPPMSRGPGNGKDVMDIKGLLQSFIQKKERLLPSYSVAELGTEQRPRYQATVKLGGGSMFLGKAAGNKRQAEKNAASAAWQHLNLLYAEQDRGEVADAVC